MGERHEPTVLSSRWSVWVECTCGWLSGLQPGQPAALTAHALHLADAKRLAGVSGEEQP